MSKKFMRKEQQRFGEQLEKLTKDCDDTLNAITEKINALKHEAEAVCRPLLQITDPKVFEKENISATAALKKIEFAIAKLGDNFGDTESSDQSSDENERAPPAKFQESGMFPPQVPTGAVTYNSDMSPRAGAFQTPPKPTSPVKPTPYRSGPPSRAASVGPMGVTGSTPDRTPVAEVAAMPGTATQAQQQLPATSKLDPGARPFVRPIDPTPLQLPVFNNPPQPSNQFQRQLANQPIQDKEAYVQNWNQQQQLYQQQLQQEHLLQQQQEQQQRQMQEQFQQQQRDLQQRLQEQRQHRGEPESNLRAADSQSGSDLSAEAPEFRPNNVVRTSYKDLRRASDTSAQSGQSSKQFPRSPRQTPQAFARAADVARGAGVNMDACVAEEPIPDGGYLKTDSWVPVTMMEVRSPIDIQIKFHSGQEAEDLEARMCAYYKKNQPKLTSMPKSMAYYACKYSVDDNWYRAMTCGPEEDSETGMLEDVRVAVLYVDFGNVEMCRVENMRELPRRLKQLPKQAACVALNKVGPKGREWGSTYSDYLEGYDHMEMEARLVCKLGTGTNEWIFADLRVCGTEKTLSDLMIEQGIAKAMDNVMIRRAFDANFDPAEENGEHSAETESGSVPIVDKVEDMEYQAASFLAREGGSQTGGSPVTVLGQQSSTASGSPVTVISQQSGSTGTRPRSQAARNDLTVNRGIPRVDSNSGISSTSSRKGSNYGGSNSTLYTSESVRYSQDSLDRNSGQTSMDSPARFSVQREPGETVTVNQWTDYLPKEAKANPVDSTGRIHEMMAGERAEPVLLSTGPMPQLGMRATNAAALDLSAIAPASSSGSRRSSVQRDAQQSPQRPTPSQTPHSDDLGLNDTPTKLDDSNISSPSREMNVTPQNWEDQVGDGNLDSGYSAQDLTVDVESGPPITLTVGRDIPELDERTIVANGGKIRFMLAHVNSLDEFFIHICEESTVEEFKKMSAELKVAYDDTKVMITHFFRDHEVKIGQLVCARWSEAQAGDDSYYRAKVVMDRRTKIVKKWDADQELEVDEVVPEYLVMFIDFGNSLWLDEGDIRPLGPGFMKYPAQAVRCSLAHVVMAPCPASDDAETQRLYRENVLLEFERICGEFQNMLVGFIYNGHNQEGSVTEPINLVILNEAGEGGPVWVNAYMVRKGLAYVNRENLVQTTNDDEIRDDPDWNPMMNDYLSQLNSYKVDVNDPEIMLHGYKAQPEEQLCRYFTAPGGCWQGDACPHRHASPNENAAPLQRPVVCTKDAESILCPRLNAWIILQTTAIENPGRFFAFLPYGIKGIPKDIPPGGSLADIDVESLTDDGYSSPMREETLAQLQESLNDHYNEIQHQGRDRDFVDLAPCEIVAAKSRNDVWYRAKVLEVDDDEIQVFFVDFGNSEKVMEENVREIEDQFLHLPFQAVECVLANIKPASADGKWPRDAKNMFKGLTDGQMLFAHVVGRSGPGRIEVDLYNTQDVEDIHINNRLVQAGHAQRLESRPKENTPPSDISFIPG